MKFIKKSIAVKTILIVILSLLVFFLLVSVIGYREVTEVLLEQYADDAYHTAYAATMALDPDLVIRYAAADDGTEEYASIEDILTSFCDATESTFIYVIQPDLTDYSTITFLFSSMNSDMHYELYESGYVRKTTNDEYRRKYRAIYEEGSERELLVRNTGYIESDAHITAMIPLKGVDGKVKALLCVQKQMDFLNASRRAFIAKISVTFLLLALTIIIAMSYYLSRWLLRPMKKIADEAGRFASENVPAEQKLMDTIRNKDEIGLLASSIDRMEDQIKEYVDNLTKITAEKEQISTELALATRIQADTLPGTFPPFPDRTEFDIFASMDPAKEVGGDFYDFFLIDDDHLCLFIADVSGKGVPAALFMMISKTILDNMAMLGKTPAEILADTNNVICAKNQEEMFVTVWLGILEISTGKLMAANAGHEYPMLCTDGVFSLYKDKHGFVIGGMEDVSYKNYEMQLKPGDRLFVYTDGLPEATDPDNAMFGTDRIVTVLNREPKAASKRILENVRRSVDHFVKDAEQFDDLTMLCLEYSGTGDGGAGK